ncbi:hypothetical protein LOAG_16007, partial [Loa loa]
AFLWIKWKVGQKTEQGCKDVPKSPLFDIPAEWIWLYIHPRFHIITDSTNTRTHAQTHVHTHTHTNTHTHKHLRI